MRLWRRKEARLRRASRERAFRTRAIHALTCGQRAFCPGEYVRLDDDALLRCAAEADDATLLAIPGVGPGIVRYVREQASGGS